MPKSKRFVACVAALSLVLTATRAEAQLPSYVDAIYLPVKEGTPVGMILVVSGAHDPSPGTREQLERARMAKVPVLAVIITNLKLVDDGEIVELIELEMRELLSSYDQPGDDIPLLYCMRD